MIEIMINEVPEHLPLKISTITWDGTSLQVYGEGWSLNTLSAWRLSVLRKMICGCYDSKASECIQNLVGETIVAVEIQDNFLRIDPVFVLSNEMRLEIFSTDTFEPWTFNIDKVGFYVPTPSRPEAFLIDTKNNSKSRKTCT